MFRSFSNVLKQSKRYLSTHLDPKTGQAAMVNISGKPPTQRLARAQARIHLGSELVDAIAANSLTKGDVLSVARIAAIMGAKQTANLIPLCHNIPLNVVQIHFDLDHYQGDVVITGNVDAHHSTGVEMEAMVATSIAALTIYDMCKSVNKGIVIREIKLLEKIGGKSGHWKLQENN